MKTSGILLTAFFLIVISKISYSQIKVDASGNVAIGGETSAQKLKVDGNVQLQSGGYIDDDGTTGGNSDDWIKLSGYIEMKSTTDSYGIVLRDRASTNYLGLTQVGGYSYFADCNTSGNYFLRGDGANAQIRGNLTVLSSADVGGTGSSSYKLETLGDIYANGGWFRVSGARGIYFQSYGGGLYMTDGSWIRTYGNKSFYHNTGTMRTDGTFQVGSGGNRFIVNTSGNVGIGMVSPSYKLDVEGTIRSNGTTVTSDARLKDNIMDLGSYMDDVKRLRPVSYNMKRPEKKERVLTDEEMLLGKTLGKVGMAEDSLSMAMQVDKATLKNSGALPANKKSENEFYDRKHIGFLAQEIQDIFPELVYEGEDGVLSVDYVSMIPILVNAIQEQQKEIEELKRLVGN